MGEHASGAWLGGEAEETGRWFGMASVGRLLMSFCCGHVTLSSLRGFGGRWFEGKQYLIGLLGLLGNIIMLSLSWKDLITIVKTQETGAILCLKENTALQFASSFRSGSGDGLTGK